MGILSYRPYKYNYLASFGFSSHTSILNYEFDDVSEPGYTTLILRLKCEKE